MGNVTHRQRSLFLWWISVLLLALSNNASGESPPSSSDPFFVYSQSFSFEYDHAEEQKHQQHQQQHRKHHLHNYEQPQHDNFDIVYSQNTAPSSTDSTTSSSTTTTSSSSSTWVSRVEQEFQTDAYSFESPFDVSMFSPEEMEKIEKQYEEQSDDNDEEDDDYNDGSCSMLSNASISRVKVVTHQEPHPATTPATAKIRGGAQTMIRTSGVPTITQTTQTFSTFPRHARHAKTSSRTILSLRGGATTTTTVVESVGSEVLKRLFVSALVTLLFEASMGHIFEFIKIAMQTSPTKTTYGAVIRDITAEKGWGGLWDGFVPWGVVQAVSKGAVFGMAHSMATHLLMPLSDTGVLPTMLVLTLAGGIGGGVQGYVLSPLLLLKTRVMTNPVFRKKLSIWKTSVLSASVGFDLVRTEGLSSLMKGANIFATKRVFDWATRFYFAEMIEALVYYLKGNQPLTLWEKSVSSFLGGVLSTILTLPLDVLVAKAQDAKKAGVKVSAFKLFNDELQEKGWKGLASDYLNGFSVRLIHVCLTVVMMKTFTNVVYEVLFG